MKTRIELKGKGYILQHPGNRAWLRLQKEMLNVSTGQFDMEKVLDYGFENVVFPEEGPKLNIDSISVAEMEVWQGLLPRFLRDRLTAGDAGPGVTVSDKAPAPAAEGLEGAPV